MWDNMTESSFRRVPIYILVDTSSSMAGALIEATNSGLRLLKYELMNNACAIELAFISIITFGGGGARVVCPLTDIMDFEPPVLTASGVTSLGDAMKKLNEAIDKEVRIRDGNYKSDYMPYVFLLIAGSPNEYRWQEAVEAVKNRQNRKVSSIITLCCSPAVNEEVIKSIPNREQDIIIIKCKKLNPEIILTYFKKLSVLFYMWDISRLYDAYKEEMGKDVNVEFVEKVSKSQNTPKFERLTYEEELEYVKIL